MSTTIIETSAAAPSSARSASHIPVFVASAAFFLSGLDVLIVNLALPTISQELGGGVSAQQWVVDGYTLPFAALLLTAGGLADRFGAKRMFGIGCALFLASSVICTFAVSMPMLIAGRCLMGVGAAMFLPSSMSVIRENYPDPKEQAVAMGYWGLGGAVAGVTGPILGGVLTPIHWSLVFGINIPVCVLILALLPRLSASQRKETPFDWPGQILALLALGGVVGGLIEGGELGFVSPTVIGLLAFGLAALAAFLFVERRATHPMMPLHLLRSYDMRVSLAIGLAFMISWYGTVFLCTSLLQNEYGLSPLVCGLIFVPSAVCGAIGNLSAPRIANMFGTRVPVLAGLALMILGLAAMAALGTHLGAVLVGVFSGIVGLGCSFVTPPVSALVLRCVDPHESGIAGAMFNTSRQIGSTLGIAIFGSLVASLPTFDAAMRVSFLTAAAMLTLVLAASTRLDR
ncbi:MFS transporter [Bifidobacterium eulemuris]|uniref:MFS transporter n=1 Tax=Bifidobacterium eulemuris TaxID=1765219 RepID=A0A261GCW3_9BIFI|nr:MFS transporter [Bifidobacterium eulemuris]OZG69260.1 MFS transporter [Bifidobacterium eulemuris]QOL31234.1 MFS transporter [Bifidobacterium eulemuris]